MLSATVNEDIVYSLTQVPTYGADSFQGTIMLNTLRPLPTSSLEAGKYFAVPQSRLACRKWAAPSSCASSRASVRYTLDTGSVQQ